MSLYTCKPVEQSDRAADDLIESVSGACAFLRRGREVQLEAAHELLASGIDLEMNPTDHLVIADDDLYTLAGMARDLIRGTWGNMSFVLQDEGQDAEGVASDILASNASIALLDFGMRHQVNGPQLVKILMEKRKDIHCIGFSSLPDKNVKELFASAGVKHVLHKNAEKPQSSMRTIAEYLREVFYAN